LPSTVDLLHNTWMDSIYLDNNATTRIDPRVAQAIYECHLAGHVNPASQHRLGRQTRRVLEQARDTVGQILGCHLSDMQADRIVFTSGGTEANNLALFGLAGRPPGRVIISAIEHPSIVGPAEQLTRLGFDVQRIRVSRDGVVQIEHLRELLSHDTRLVSVMLANNETGVMQPVSELAELCAEAGVPLHTDAVQVVGKLPVHFRRLGVAAMSLAAHKFHGPRGIGALILRSDVRLAPTLFGGFQQEGLRPGTESVALAVGLSRALELWAEESAARQQRMTLLRDQFEAAIRAEMPDAVINGAAATRLPHTISLSFPGIERQSLLMALDLAGIACSAGSACASGSSELSTVLLAMGIEPEVITGSIRISLGADSTTRDIAEAIRLICNNINNLRKSIEAE
jgi:cysteine desulfurase